jgi:hypothetical protein
MAQSSSTIQWLSADGTPFRLLTPLSAVLDNSLLIEELKIALENNCIVDRKTNCWNWNLNKAGEKYGWIYYIDNRQIGVHRIMASLTFYGFNIDSPLFVCHKCDNPSCINPKHLFIGTQQDNTDDMVKKKRHAFGEKNGHHKLTDKDVINIRFLYSNGETMLELSKMYDVSKEQIRNIIHKISWKYI